MSHSLVGMLDFLVLVPGLRRLGFPFLSLVPLIILILIFCFNLVLEVSELELRDGGKKVGR